MVHSVIVGHPAYPLLFPKPDRFRRAATGNAFPVFYFKKYKILAIITDQIDLTLSAPEIPLLYPDAVFFQISVCKFLFIRTDGSCIYPFFIDYVLFIVYILFTVYNRNLWPPACFFPCLLAISAHVHTRSFFRKLRFDLIHRIYKYKDFRNHFIQFRRDRFSDIQSR